MVFIPHSAVINDNITWPKRYLKKPGVFEFREINEVFDILLDSDVMKGKYDNKDSEGVITMNLFGDDFHADATD